ncbi:uncharacterized protein MELLADRAFT_116867 [Melampsora larici-populina 98AG31]|uniref:Protein kinase domain-containing protein n=1 Tax=Melampsora larici-populina (strain 98AG31 / pathotype 3-4-7) TaxID=747676 RepID=F4RQV8_MELLP|nr:uncharacterized protein MELLADRAFT_116867 [Melampsora larici-populina 98AG31]EGG05259.1 hypothetical protein MELLADRAFT_116867 [Melampsora larici-populina 98AG31]
MFGRQPDSYIKKKEYKYLEILGQGSFGFVKRAIWIKREGVEVAIKCIKKKSLNGQEQLVHDETKLLKGLDHPNIVKLFDWFESRDKFYLVFEIASGGELFNRICDEGKFTEKDAIKAIKSILEGLNYLHQHNIVHRDLKPENLLYKSKGDDDTLVIADFGIAHRLKSDTEVLTAMCGSPGYAAPEILNRIGHGKPVDLWSVGVITYTLLCGYTPFRSENRAELIKETTKGKIEFHHQYWKNVSAEAKEFVTALIKPVPLQRLTAEQALNHKWITDTDQKLVEEFDISKGLKENWGARRKWKAAINAIRATNRMKLMTSSSNSEEDEDQDSTSPTQPSTISSTGDQISHKAATSNSTAPSTSTALSIGDENDEDDEAYFST